MIATLDPTLALRIGRTNPEFNFSTAGVGGMFCLSSLVFTLCSIPIGWICDHHEGNCRVFKGWMAIGFAALGVTFMFLGPMDLNGEWKAFDHVGFVVVAMILKGFGSAVAGTPAYPDLAVAVPRDIEDDMITAKISTIWNSAYAVGWAAGPLIGGWLCQEKGFSGYATVMAWISFGFAFVMGAAAVMNLRPAPVVSAILYLPVKGIKEAKGSFNFASADVERKPFNSGGATSPPTEEYGIRDSATVEASPSVRPRKKRAHSLSAHSPEEADHDSREGCLHVPSWINPYGEYESGQMAAEEGILPGYTLPTAMLHHHHRGSAPEGGEIEGDSDSEPSSVNKGVVEVTVQKV